MKATAIAPSNIAFVKYWGKKDEKLRLPENASISMNLSNLLTMTTVEFLPSLKTDDVVINGEKASGLTLQRVEEQLNRIRDRAKISDKAKVASENNFPRGTGLSSSASGFAALTLAAEKAAELNLTEKELSILARQSSGSACRSIPDGFVEWLDGDTSETSYSVSIFSPDYWSIVDIVVVLSNNIKDVLTSEGQKIAKSSPFFSVRLQNIQKKINECKRLIKAKKFTEFGKFIEAEALELHAIMLTSTPSLIYWLPMTVRLMHLVKNWRREGTEVYFTVNTGQNIHLVVEEKNKDKVLKELKNTNGIINVTVNKPSVGARLVNEHLF